jgi:hypothetical protein
MSNGRGELTFWEELRKRRGTVRGGVIEGVFARPRDAAPRFGLHADAGYAPISAEEARRTLVYALSHELVYGSAAMARRRAERFVETFAKMARLDHPESRLFSNGAEPPIYVESPFRTYSSATDATFEAGVLVIATDRCACLWVEDED